MAVNGILTGRVVQLGNDPRGEHRIMVLLPLLGATPLWARIASFDPGASFFRPEIGSEVIVGFVNGSPMEPVVLGALFSPTTPLPLPLSDANTEKGILTGSNLLLQFNDATKTITIKTPAGNSIVMNENGKSLTIRDQSGSTVTMDASGLMLESKKDIIVKAGTTLTLSAKGEVRIKGAVVKIN